MISIGMGFSRTTGEIERSPRGRIRLESCCAKVDSSPWTTERNALLGRFFALFLSDSVGELDQTGHLVVLTPPWEGSCVL